jgi:hypothetical protein
MEMSIVPENLAAISAAFAAAPDITLKHLARAIDASLLYASREIEERTPTGANQLLRKSMLASESVDFAKPIQGGLLGVVGTSIDYAVPVELGTQPHFPPLAPLADYAVAKMGVERKRANTVAYFIARKIAKHGTTGAFMFREGAKQTEPYLNQQIQEAMQDALAEIGGMA